MKDNARNDPDPCQGAVEPTVAVDILVGPPARQSLWLLGILVIVLFPCNWGGAFVRTVGVGLGAARCPAPSWRPDSNPAPVWRQVAYWFCGRFAPRRIERGRSRANCSGATGIPCCGEPARSGCRKVGVDDRIQFDPQEAGDSPRSRSSVAGEDSAAQREAGRPGCPGVGPVAD